MFIGREVYVDIVDGVAAQGLGDLRTECVVQAFYHQLATGQGLTILIQYEILWSRIHQAVDHGTEAGHCDPSGTGIEIDDAA